MVPLALFSNDLSCVKKDQISKAIQNHNAVTLTNRHGTSFGKPNFPVVSKNQKNRSLSMFVGPDSLGFFRILRLESEFLKYPSSEWSNRSSYQYAKKVVDAIQVVNDAAERGVKLASDYLDSAKIEENYQNILQVVENHRHLKPNQRDKKFKPKSWYLTL